MAVIDHAYNTANNALSTTGFKCRFVCYSQHGCSYQDNILACLVMVTQQALDDLGTKVLVHPPYSSDLAQCKFFFFHNFQN